MRFSWDPAKDEANWRKHGVGFEAAVTVFDDEFLVVQEDRFIDGELRWHALGQSAEHVLLLVVHTVQGEWEDTLRILSARKAEKMRGESMHQVFYERVPGEPVPEPIRRELAKLNAVPD